MTRNPVTLGQTLSFINPHVQGKNANYHKFIFLGVNLFENCSVINSEDIIMRPGMQRLKRDDEKNKVLIWLA
jgi:hypothetical protein